MTTSRTSRTALVTGASSGIGRELAALFAADGHDVILVARRKDRLESLASELNSRFGITTTVIVSDLSQPDSPEKIYSAVRERGLEVDYLVNNAGFGFNSLFWEDSREQQLSMIQVNVLALTALTHLFVGDMLKRKFGHVLNISSAGGFASAPMMAVYLATKSFVLHFTEGLASELEDTGVAATVFCPGATATEFGERSESSSALLFYFGFTVDSPAAAARAAYKAMLRKKRLSIMGLSNWLIARVLPRGVLNWAAGILLRKRT
jgi:uncharacterized protein